MAEAFTDAGYNIAEIHSNFGEARNIRLEELKELMLLQSEQRMKIWISYF